MGYVLGKYYKLKIKFEFKFISFVYCVIISV